MLFIIFRKRIVEVAYLDNNVQFFAPWRLGERIFSCFFKLIVLNTFFLFVWKAKEAVCVVPKGGA